MGRKDFDIDDLIKGQEERESRAEASKNSETAAPKVGKTYIGLVEKYFSGLKVAAVVLEDSLSVGDVIEIGDDDNAIRQRVESMQIERENVEEAHAGDSVGILVHCPVERGAAVYKINKQLRSNGFQN
ncbi:MAG: hypothetical protein ACP5SJ_02400 [Candidatus Micrarchaeia archaeon]